MRLHVTAFAALLLLSAGASLAQGSSGKEPKSDPGFSSRWQGPTAVEPGATEKPPQLKPPARPFKPDPYADPRVDGPRLELRPPYGTPDRPGTSR